eukprot:c11627_g1_i1.p1 GENE.c11627_g1_i1~~c11627_g1_i1.p1  ORF type:complete len:1189 (+),score=336.18 c11627_g1_i1:2-3568(+)
MGDCNFLCVRMGVLHLLLCCLLLCTCRAIPKPPLSMLQQNALSPRAPAPLHQSLVQQSQNYVDDDGDTHIVFTSNRPPPRGYLGSTAHLKDDQFVLFVPFTEVEFDSVLNVTWVRPPAQVSKLDYIGLYSQGDPDDGVPCNWAFAPGEGSIGHVSIQMTNHGAVELRYYDVASARPRARFQLTVFPPCVNNCSNHGVCQKGACVCFSPYKGEECCQVDGTITVSVNTTTAVTGEIVHVTLTAPPGLLDSHNWIGLFHASPANTTTTNTATNMTTNMTTAQGDIRHQLLQSQLGTVSNEIETVNTSALVWRYVQPSIPMPMPYMGGDYVLMVIDAVPTHPVLAKSPVIHVFNRCANNCSGHGECVNGTCHCHSAYDHVSDCSIGEGVVEITVTPSECVVGCGVHVVWERNTDGGFSDLDYLALFDKNDTSFDAPFAYQFAQAHGVKVHPSLPREPKRLVDRGSVVFSLPLAQSVYVVRYFRKDHALFGVSLPITAYFDCSNPNCSDHGTCEKGVCRCNQGWRGSECSIGDVSYRVSAVSESLLVSSSLHVTYWRPAGAGSPFDFVAVYARGAPNEAPLVYRYADHTDEVQQQHEQQQNDTVAHADATSNITTVMGTVSFPLPSVPGTYEVRYIDAFTRETMTSSTTFDLHPPCPNGCSGHGACIKGVCMCVATWTARDDCSAKVGSIHVSVAPLSLEAPSATKLNVTYSRPEGSGYATDFIGLFLADQVDNSHPVDFAIPANDSGLITLSAPHYAGIYQVRYVGGEGGGLVRGHSLSIDVAQACPNGCSGHGRCNRGTCVCIYEWGGIDCSVGQGPTSVVLNHKSPVLSRDEVRISYSRAPNSGSERDVLAFYKQGAPDTSAPLAFVQATKNDNDTVVGIVPTTEAMLEVHYVRTADHSSLGHSVPFKVVLVCMNNCSTHGTCQYGICTCDAGWDGQACDKAVPKEFKVTCGNSSIESQGDVQITWEVVPRAATHNDYVGLYSSSNPNGAALVFEYTAPHPSGSCVLVAPSQPGAYIAKYMSPDPRSSGAITRAMSAPFTVIPAPKMCPNECSGHGTCNSATGVCTCEAGWAEDNCATQVPMQWTVTVSAKEYLSGSSIDVSWTRPPHNTGNYLDSIGIFLSDELAKRDAVTHQYTGTGFSGHVTLQAPATALSPQHVTVVFVNGATGQHMASSPQFNIVKALKRNRNA